MKKLIFTSIIFVYGILFPQKMRVDKIEPPNWWPGLENNIQLMVYGENLSGIKASFDSPGISVKKINKTENSSYSFIDISISKKINPGDYKIIFSRGNETIQYNFPILKRTNDKKNFRGFNSEDIIYLIMPDRFSDGDRSNNVVNGMINDFKPGNPLGRHGGDLQGIINHLDYFTGIGVNTLWLTPVLENNTSISYHGYASTDLYKIDPRLGTNEKYKELVNSAHNKNLKIIYDHVSNHISINHPWISNPPLKDWINGTKENHLNAWHDKMVRWDTHSAQLTNDHVTRGWFVEEMPDLNQRNPFVRNYLLQNTLWWIEYAGLDGIREDTYPYVDENFSSEWAKKILNLYPHFNIVGEVWTGDPAFLAPYQKGSKLNKGKDTHLPVVTDFGLRDAYFNFLKGKSNLHAIYNVISMDFLYKNPNGLLVFADNHDLVRAMFSADGNIDKVKLIFTHMLTSRGIPQILYGTEIGMKGNEDHGLIRSDFPGGFPDDSTDCFTSSGRTSGQNELFLFFKKLISVRAKYKSLNSGVLMHLPPVSNVYLYTKKLGSESMLVALNGNNSLKEISIDLVEQLCGRNFKLTDVMNNSGADIKDGKLILKPMSGSVYKIDF
jgi:glycosidase